jgi:hypothetical protein
MIKSKGWYMTPKRKTGVQKKWWETTPAIISAVAAMIVAITGLITLFHKSTSTPVVVIRPIEAINIKTNGPKENPKPPILKDEKPFTVAMNQPIYEMNASMETGITRQPCDVISIKTFPVFPYYLVNSYNRYPENNNIYWLSLDGKNICTYRLHVKVWFHPDPSIAQVRNEEFIDTLQIAEKINKKKNPGLEIKAKTDQHFPLPGSYRIWALSDSKAKRILKQDNFSIQVIAANHVYWDLKDPDGKQVDFGFLLASLSAWSILPEKPPSQLRKLATRYLSPGSDPEKWMKACYGDLFHSDTHMVIQSLPGYWPPQGAQLDSLQKIRTPAMVLEGKRANSLEAALLIAALKNAASEELNFRMVLFALPVDSRNDEGEKRFLLGWSHKGKEWRAVDLSDPNNVDFDANVQEATDRLATVLQQRGQEISGSLKEKGVFYDEKQSIAKQTLLALDFEKAPKHYFIAGLSEE